MVSEYLRFPFKVKIDYFIPHSIFVYSFVIFLTFFAMNKRRRKNEAALLNKYHLQKDFLNIKLHFTGFYGGFYNYGRCTYEA